jgi:hypothetical protein
MANHGVLHIAPKLNEFAIKASYGSTPLRHSFQPDLE